MTLFTKNKIEELLVKYPEVIKVYLNGDLTDLTDEPTFLVVIDDLNISDCLGVIHSGWMDYLHEICYNASTDSTNVWVSVCRENEIQVCMNNECPDLDETNLVYDRGRWCVDAI